LAVHHDGTMLLKDLMRHWGHGEGLSEDTVLDAARKHMFHDDHRQHMRFVINCNTQGITIRVMPKRRQHSADGVGRHDANLREWSRPPRAHAVTPFRRQGPREPKFQPPVSTNPFARHEVHEPKFQAPVAQPECQSLGAEKKLEMGLDDIIACERHPMPAKARVVSPVVPPLPMYKAPPPLPPQASPIDPGKADRLRHRLAQMGHTLETRHVRRPRQQGLGARPQQQQQQPQQRQQRQQWRGGQMSPAERIQRWVSWVMKRGHAELGVAVDTRGGGWRAQLGELADAIRRAKPDFGEFDARSLHAVLESSNATGRFEFSDSCIRLVPRDERLAQQCPPSNVVTSEPRGRRSRSSSAASSSSSRRGVADAAPHSFSIATPRGSYCEGLGATRAPSPPPWGGENTDVWTKYKDKENGDCVWWRYEGPLGSWWCPEGEEVVPYVDDL